MTYNYTCQYMTHKYNPKGKSKLPKDICGIITFIYTRHFYMLAAIDPCGLYIIGKNKPDSILDLFLLL